MILLAFSLNMLVNVDRPERIRAPPRNVVLAPLQGQVLRQHQEDREVIFEPRHQRDYDDEAPLEPPRNLTEMARLAADRVATRLELMEMSPALRELRNQLVELKEAVARLDEHLGNVSRRVMTLEDVTADAVSRTASLERYHLELQEVDRIRSKNLLCLFVALAVGLFLSVYSKF